MLPHLACECQKIFLTFFSKGSLGEPIESYDLREGKRQAGMLAFPFAAALERERLAERVSHVNHHKQRGGDFSESDDRTAIGNSRVYLMETSYFHS